MKRLLFVAVAMLIGCSGGESAQAIDQNDVAPDSDIPDSTSDAGDSGDSNSIDSNDSALSEASVDSSPLECNPGEMGCDSKVPWSCDTSGKKQASKACGYICDKGKCVGDCLPGDKQCDSTVKILQLCDTSGTWQTLQECAMTCDSGTKQCVGYWCCDNNANTSCNCFTSVTSCPTKADHCESSETFCCMASGTSCHCVSESYMNKHASTCEDYITWINQFYPQDSYHFSAHCGG